MFVKLQDVPQLLYFNVQTDIRFLLQQLIFYNAYLLDTRAVVIKSSRQFARYSNTAEARRVVSQI